MSTQQNTIKILENLIGFPSISAVSNLPVIEYIEAYLNEKGISSRRIPNEDGTKSSLLATIGPEDQPGIVLSAHTDVVPTEGQNWSSPPFTATIRDGRVIGRGATDMKGFLASVLSHVDAFRTAATTSPVHLAFSYDEEVGCLGAPDLAAALSALPVRPALCIVGEPTGLRVVRAHKGKVTRRVIFTGRGGHSALPHRAANAVMAAARLATRLGDLSEEVAQMGLRDPAFDPPWTTIHVGALHGGSAVNLVPETAILDFEIRDVPGTDTAALLAVANARLVELEAGLKAQAPEAAVLVEPVAVYPPLAIEADHPAVATVARLADSNEPAGGVSFGTEAGIYAAAGIPTVVCGPGDIGRAHKADEWIGVDELAAADRMMERLAAQLGRPAEEWIRA